MGTDTETAAELEARVRAAITRAFNLSGTEALGELQMGAFPEWDSLTHMDLIATLEREFQVTFPSYSLSELTNTSAIIRHITQLRLG